MFSTFLHADTIYLKDGRSFEGEITQETNEMVTLKENVGGTDFIESSYKKSDIQQIETSDLKEEKAIQKEKGKQKRYSSESENYKYNVIYPEIVKTEKTNKIAITIFNKSNIIDKSLTLESRDITEGDGVARLLKDWDKSTFRILKVEPEPISIESILGATYFDYEGIKAGETKNILLYFKISKPGYYLQKLSFYTDKHGDEEYELISVIKIVCKE